MMLKELLSRLKFSKKQFSSREGIQSLTKNLVTFTSAGPTTPRQLLFSRLPILRPYQFKGYYQQSNKQSHHNSDQQKRYFNSIGEDARFDKFKDWSWFIFSSFAGFALANVWPTSFMEENSRKFRKKLGTDILEIENQHIIPEPRDYSQYIERTQSIYKIDSFFNNIIQEKNQRVISSGMLGGTFFYELGGRLPQRGVSTLLIIGAQGSGKSELVEEYANKYAIKIANILPSAVRTVKIFRAENEDGLKRQYREFARELSIDVQNYSDDDNSRTLLIKKVNEKLVLRDHWLLVFDNVNEKQNYELVKQFIPTGKMLGRVILTSRERNIIPEKDSLDVKIMDVHQKKYRFTSEEAVSLIDQTLGNSPLKHNLGVEHKIEFAKQLYFLPHAIKKSILYIKNSKKCKDVNAYQKLVMECLQEQLNSTEIDKLDEYQRYKVINDSVNMLSIRAISESNLANSILSFSAFLNPDCIQRELLELGFVKFKKVEKGKFINALELLRAYGLFEDKGQGHFKIHRSITKLVLSATPMIQWKNKKYFRTYGEYYKDDQKIRHEKEFFQRQLCEVIDFTKQYFKRDNIEVDTRRRNALFAVHIDVLQEIYNQNNPASNIVNSELGLILVSIKVALATHYMMTGHSVKGREILEKNKTLIELQCGLKGVLDDLQDNQKKLKVSKKRKDFYQKSDGLALEKNVAQEEKNIIFLSRNIQNCVNRLASVQTDILSIYAQTLYHFGCSYYDIGDKENNPIYKKSLEQAIIVRDIIDKKIESNPQEKQRDAKFNEFELDSKIMKRNGIYKFYYKETQMSNELEFIAKKYSEMIETEINKPKYSQDKKHIRSCKTELSRIYQKLSKIEIDRVKKREYGDKATQMLYYDDINHAFSMNNGRAQIDYKVILDWILTNPDLKNDTRKARYLNDLGDLLRIQGNYELAASCYINAISLFEENENVNSDLPNSCLGLALACEEMNAIELAQKAIRRCLFAQNALGIPRENEDAKRARSVSDRIEGIEEINTMEMAIRLSY